MRRFVIPFTNFKVFTTRNDFIPFIIFIDFINLVKRKTEKKGNEPTVDKIMINKSKIFHLYLKKFLLYAMNFSINSKINM